MEVRGCSLAAERWRGATTLRAGGATNGPSPGCVSVTAPGLELGSRGFSSRSSGFGSLLFAADEAESKSEGEGGERDTDDVHRIFPKGIVRNRDMEGRHI